MRRFLAIALVVAFCVPSMGTIIFRRAAGCADSDDFSGDLSCWSQINGTWAIVSGQLDVTGATDHPHIEHNNTFNEDQWIKFKLATNPTSSFYGVIMRADGAGTGYFMRLPTGSGTNFRFSKTTDSCDSNTNIETSGTLSTLNSGDWVGVKVSATGASTVVDYFDFGTSDPGDCCGGSWASPTFSTSTNPGASEITGSGTLGFCGPSNYDDARIDDFKAGNI